MMEKKHSDIGTKLMNELMVDIIGAVIPGLLFIIVVIISIAIPCCIYLGPTIIDKLSELLKGSGWWVMLIVCIIFSYVVGQIFYRADIYFPDSKDVMRQVKKNVKRVVTNKNDKKRLFELIKQQVKILNDRFQESSALQDKFITLYTACTLFSRNNEEINIAALQAILFPEDFNINRDHEIEGQLSDESRDVINTYKRLIRHYGNNFYTKKEILDLATYYCILYCQMDLGCATAKRCEFPYLNYYKYLLKRNLIDLLKYVDWHTVEERTKNKVNSLKIKIQIFASEAYALINKNESHIRMSSSTWHISKLLLIIAFMASLITLIPLCISLRDSMDSIHENITSTQEIILSQKDDIVSIQENNTSFQGYPNNMMTIHNCSIAFAAPFLMLLFVLYIKNRITKFIHYQRMREIQYTLQIYEQCEYIIKARQRPTTNNRVLII